MHWKFWEKPSVLSIEDEVSQQAVELERKLLTTELESIRSRFDVDMKHAQLQHIATWLQNRPKSKS